MKPLDPRLLPHLTPARLPLAGVVAASTLAGLLLVAQAFAVAALVTSLFSGATGGSWDGAVRAATALGLVTAGRALASWLVDVLSARASARVTGVLRHRLLTAALGMGPFELSRRRSGEIALLVTRGVAAVDPYLTRYLPALVVASVLPAVTVVAIATQDLLSAGIVLATLPLIPLFAVLVGLATRDRADRQWRSLTLLSGHFVDVMRGLPTLVAFRRAGAQSASIRAVTDRYRRATNETLRLAFASSAVLELVATISVALVAVVVGLRLAGGSLDLGTALVVLLLAPEAYWPLRRVGAEFHAAAEGTATFEAADALLRSAPVPDEAPHPRRPVLTAAQNPLDPSRTPPGTASTRPERRLVPSGTTDADVSGPVELRGLTVRYPGRSQPVLRDLTATLPERGVTAVVGPSGSGKSTLLAALMGHLELDAGSVAVGGTVIDPSSSTWRSRIAWVPQRPWIVAGTIADNVRLGRPEATDLEVWAALERVALGEVVAALPDGLHEGIGEDGAGLSAGERARLALARAVVADRPMVLLDEPTAHLDPLTESVVAETVTWLGERSCVVVVAHRQALVALAGHVVEVPLRELPAQRATPSAPPSADGPATPGTTATAPGPSTATSADDASAADRPRARLALGSLLGVLAAASGVALTATAGWLIARAAEHPPVLMLMVAIVGVRTFGLARPVLRYAERLVSHDVALRLLAERRAEVYDALVPLVPGRLGRQRGDVLASIVDDVDSLVDRHLRVRAPLVTYAAVSVLATVFAAWVLPAAGLVVGTTLLVGGLLAHTVSRRGVARAEERYVAGRAALSSAVMRTLQGAADLVMWQAAPRFVGQVDRTGARLERAAGHSARAVATGRALALLASGLGVLAVAWVGGPALAEGRVSAPMLALLVLLPLALLEVVAPLADVGALQVRVAAADHRLAEVADTLPAVADPPVPVAPPATSPAPSLALEGVTAGWGSPVFEGLDLHLPPGSRVGVVGPSGSGKSTLAAVLLRFLDPVAGTYTIAGIPASAMLLDDVRRCVGLVDDDPHVFSSTVYENVRLARPDATEADVERALRAVRLGPWLDELPDRLHTRLGEGHAHVSGGERARIGMARAVLADLPVLVLDEPTAHLDTATAEAVAGDLLDVSTGRSVVWITHSEVGLDRVDSVLDLGRSPRLTPADV
ncbi:MAG TPA: thiol reductant ABC exporter subunit CydD [Nocardioidaceae bacterium]